MHLADARGGERWLRVSWHRGGREAVLSVWRDGSCVGTTRLTREDASDLIGFLASGLVEHDGSEPMTEAG